MDLTQVLIAFSLFIISVSVVVCTVFLISLIKELKNAVIKATEILANTQQITGSIARPVTSFSDFLMGFKNGFHLFNTFFKDKNKN